MEKITLQTKKFSKKIHPAKIEITYKEFVELIEKNPEVLFTLNFFAAVDQDAATRYSSNYRKTVSGESSGFSFNLDDYFNEIPLPNNKDSVKDKIKSIYDKWYQSILEVGKVQLAGGGTAFSEHGNRFYFTIYRRQAAGFHKDTYIDKPIHTFKFNAKDPISRRRAVFSALVWTLIEPGSFVVGSYRTSDDPTKGRRYDFLYSDVYGIYDRAYIDASDYGRNNLKGAFFWEKYVDGRYPDIIIPKLSEISDIDFELSAKERPLFKFFEPETFVSFNVFHNYEKISNINSIEDYVIRQLIEYFKTLSSLNSKYDIRDNKGDIYIYDLRQSNPYIKWLDPLK